jgi:dCTP deaminase
MILTHNELKAMVDAGFIENVPGDNINGASIDLTLADEFWVESWGEGSHTVDLGAKEAPGMTFQKGGSLVLAPGEFCLAATEQIFHLPDDIAGHYMLKSSLARAGLNHLFAGFADPTWHGSALTLEFKNELRHHSIKLTPGMKCGQIVFFKGSSPVPVDRAYALRGQYNHSAGAQPSKGAR